MKNAKKVLAAILAVGLLFSSCGEPEETPEPKEEYDSKGHLICKAELKGESTAFYDSVRMGGGGYVTGIVIHPLDPDLMYIRTDVGGMYRWDKNDGRWIQLSDSVDNAEAYGVSGMAVDPRNTDILFACFGNKGGMGVYRSENKGDTWEATDLVTGFYGNGDYKEMGECIAVDPNNSNIVLCGTTKSGGFVSTDGGKTWKSNKMGGVRSIAFDKSSFKDGRSMTIYATSYGGGLSRSTDGGETWTVYKDGPALAANVRCADDGVAYMAGAGGVYRIAGDKVVNITPKKCDRDGLALAVDPKNSKRVAFCGGASTKEKYSPHRIPIYYSNDGGETWVSCLNGTRNSTVPWWPNYYFSSATAGMAFRGKELWFTDWYGVWFADNIEAGNKKVWTNVEKGHEEMVTFHAFTSPTDEYTVIFSQADNGLIRYTDDVDEYPLKREGNGQFMDYFAEDPGYLVCAGGTNNSASAAAVMKYEETGETDENGKPVRKWVSCSGWDENVICHDIAISADNRNCMVVTVASKAPFYTLDGGETWQESESDVVSSVSSYWDRTKCIASDKVHGNVFYLVSGGKLYRSEDYGVTWNERSSGISGTTILTYPGRADELWVAGKKFYHSTDGGETWTVLENVSGGIALGASRKGDDGEYTLLLIGQIGDSERGLYYSEDYGKTWTHALTERENKFTAIASIYGDVNKFGRAYLGTSGCGWLYADMK